MPLQRRVPKRGFHNVFKTIYAIVNVDELKRFAADSEVDHKSLSKAGLVKKSSVKIKLLGRGEIDRPLKVKVHACTRAAKERVEKAGGKVHIVTK